jgi:glycosyltransferase involved in cell wall biosynthesis
VPQTIQRHFESIQISVITSLYRCEAFLANFLQYYSAIDNIDQCELIIVHNDPTQPELDMLAASRIKRMVHIRVGREGLYNSWNRAVMMAKGKFVAIWNVDDIRTPDSLVTQYNALTDSGAALCYGDFYGTSIYGAVKEHLYEYGQYADFKKEIFKRHIIGCFPMWRKDIHMAIGYFDEQFRLAGDFEFQLRVAVNFPLVKANSILGYYLEFAEHKLSSNKLLQHSERTAIQLRYRLYDKLLIHFLPFISRFRLNHIKNFGKWLHIYGLKSVFNNEKPGAINGLIKMPFSYGYWFFRWSSQQLVNRTIYRNQNKQHH